MLLIASVRNTARRIATPPAITGWRSSPSPGMSIFFTLRASTSRSRSHFNPSQVMIPLPPSRSRSAEATDRIVPEEPSTCSQPSAIRRRFAGRISTCALISARSNASSVIFPSSKKRSDQETQPMSRLASSRTSNPSPTITSVLPPPMSTTSRRPRTNEAWCDTPR